MTHLKKNFILSRLDGEISFTESRKSSERTILAQATSALSVATRDAVGVLEKDLANLKDVSASFC